jgi:primosomal protein N' (replication factor Y)
LRLHVAADGLSPPLIAAIKRHLEAGGQVLLYLNRRGFAPALICPACAYCATCRRCDARMVWHREGNRLQCHHCGAELRLPEGCPECGGVLYPVGQGTERLEGALATLFPVCELVRLDRDTTRKRGALEERLQRMASGQARIMVGTQMLAKGHDFPGVTLVGVVDADQGLFGSDFRASERLAQSFVQVAGRAGRGERPGEVYIQTLFPDHPLLSVLLGEGYDRFAEEAMAERRAAGWPPYSHLALLRAEAGARTPAQEFLNAARVAGESLAVPGIELLGPAAAPMERRAGRYRAQLLAQTCSRPRMQQFLVSWRQQIAELPEARRTRWSLDVDPVELY